MSHAENASEQVAWAAFDAAALELQAMYARAEAQPEAVAAAAAERHAKAAEVMRLWEAWRDLFARNDPRPIA